MKVEESEFVCKMNEAMVEEHVSNVIVNLFYTYRKIMDIKGIIL